MKSFKIKAYLAAGLSYRLQKMEEQKVVDTLSAEFAGKPSAAIRANLKVASAIEEANKPFMEATKEIFDKKTEAFNEFKKDYDEETKGMTPEEAGKVAQKLRAEFDQTAAEIQKESKAKPEEEVEVKLSDDDYSKVLLPMFEKTVGTWDDSGEGLGQKFFIEVADAIEHVTES